jgi:type I restriction-modification system DNA methylase subunit
MSERVTENIVRDKLRKLGYYSQNNSIRVEEQKSEVEAVKKLLKAASKTGKGGGGAPEFIVSCADNPDFLLVVECKADLRQHESAGKNKPADFAVDGVLHYASHLSKGYSVIAVAISGQTLPQAKISTFLFPKGATTYKPLATKGGIDIDTIVAWDDYIEHATFDPTVQRLRHDELMDFATDLHDFMRDHAKLTESQKPLLVSGTLLALQNTAFAKSYDEYKPEELPKQWFKVIEEEMEKAQLPQAKKNSMTQPYSAIAVHPVLGSATAEFPRGILYELIKRLNDKVWPFVSIYHDFDVVGQFYGEFLKYTGGDKKALGIVLTPRHITELFARLSNVSKNDTILDICAGTGGFLIAAMHRMMQQATTQKEKLRIKSRGLVGIEQQPDMYALAASNMILRGDGKANLYQGSCFTDAIVKEVKTMGCNVGLLNPPYSGDPTELMFVKHMLDCLKIGGTGITIVPMSCAITPNPVRDELMKFHTLEAVMSMPDDLFYPVGTVVCIMIWTAGTPHAVSGRKTWFGYWKHDGFVKTKHKGRIDLKEHWPNIRDHWVESYRNREVRPGESITRKVGPQDEWCAEAYLETDYSKLNQSSFEKTVRSYAMFKLIGETGRGKTV